MTIIPTVHCRSMAESISFYTKVLDFECLQTSPPDGEPAFSLLKREGDELHLSTHSGDGVAGQAIAILTPDADALFRKYLARGLDVSRKPQSPVHQGPFDQSWGTREFYVDDPSGNTLRFIQRSAP